MVEKIFEIKIVDIECMSRQAREQIIKEVASKPSEFRTNFKGFAKITYATASPPRIINIEPIKGTIVDYFESMEEEIGSDFSVF